MEEIKANEKATFVRGLRAWISNRRQHYEALIPEEPNERLQGRMAILKELEAYAAHVEEMP